LGGERRWSDLGFAKPRLARMYGTEGGGAGQAAGEEELELGRLSEIKMKINK